MSTSYNPWVQYMKGIAFGPPAKGVGITAEDQYSDTEESSLSTFADEM
jgi:hypothetical protein